MGVLRLRTRWSALLLLLSAAVGPLCAQPSREYDLKAAFLYNFAAFVDWPPQAFRHEEAPFVIGVFGIDPFGSTIDEIAAGETAKQRPLVVRRMTSMDEISGAHILFVSRSEAHRLREVLRHAAGHAILTVSDAPGFNAAGGMIEFGLEGSRIVLNVNVAALERAELLASSKLLRVSRLVRGPSRIR